MKLASMEEILKWGKLQSLVQKGNSILLSFLRNTIFPRSKSLIIPAEL